MTHYGQILEQPWKQLGVKPAVSWSCLQSPSENNGVWNIRYPTVDWGKNSVVLLHLQDFVNVDADGIRELDMIERHYGELAHRVVVVHWNWSFQDTYQGALNLVHFNTHEYEIVCNLAASFDTWQPQLLQPRTRIWQCLNGVQRSHRNHVVAALQPYSGTVSLGDQIVLPQWPYHTSYRGTSNEENFQRLLPLYADHDINIVTETQYEYRPGIVTEKTFFAWLTLQVPILIGYPGMIQDCREMGFDTFDDIVDNSHDWASSSHRAEKAIQSNSQLLLNGIDRPALMPRLLANQAHALHTWPQHMIQHYQHWVFKTRVSIATV